MPNGQRNCESLFKQTAPLHDYSRTAVGCQQDSIRVFVKSRSVPPTSKDQGVPTCRDSSLVISSRRGQKRPSFPWVRQVHWDNGECSRRTGLELKRRRELVDLDLDAFFCRPRTSLLACCSLPSLGILTRTCVTSIKHWERR
jgi:hypothetical protein